MTEQEALNTSTMWVNGKDNLYGYLSLKAANFLISTGKYIFQQSSPWGYIVRKIK